MVILGAVAAAVGWGTSDYLGGDVSRRDAPVFVIVALSELIGVALLAPALIAQGRGIPISPRLLFAALTGVSTTIELGLIYRALSRGRALITAPVGALGAAAAAVVGVVAGDPLDAAIIAGLACALLGSAISSAPSPGTLASSRFHRGDGLTCLAAAASVGATLTLLHAAGRLDPYWVTSVQHASTAASAGVAALIMTRRSQRTPRDGAGGMLGRRRLVGLGLIAVAGTGGDLAYVSASNRGSLSIVAAIASLYPVMTIALARALRGHRATHVQLAGVALALGGAVLLGAAAG